MPPGVPERTADCQRLQGTLSLLAERKNTPDGLAVRTKLSKSDGGLDLKKKDFDF